MNGSVLTCVSASAYTLTASSVPDGRTKARADLNLAVSSSMLSCSFGGVTARLSSSVVLILCLSATYK